MTRRLLTGALLLALAAPTAIAAQEGPGFLFRTPRLSIGARIGLDAPRAGSGIFDFLQDTLTVGQGDLNTVNVGALIAFRATERFDVALDFGVANSTTTSEYRYWVGVDDLPIAQTTEFRRVPFSVSGKYYVMERGRSLSRFVWVPAQWAPWVGGGVGVTAYRFEVTGEFLGEGTPDDRPIFNDRLFSDGTAATAHVMGGVDVSLTPRFFLTTEARYSWGRTDMGVDFQGYDIDLSGFRATLGVSARF